jgi:hypothetical protein
MSERKRTGPVSAAVGVVAADRDAASATRPARRLGAFAAAALLLSLAGGGDRVSADGNAGGNGARGHVKLGLPF